MNEFYTFEEAAAKTRLETDCVEYIKNLLVSKKITIMASKKGFFTPPGVNVGKRKVSIFINIVGKAFLGTTKRQTDVLASIYDSIIKFENVYGKI